MGTSSAGIVYLGEARGDDLRTALARAGGWGQGGSRRCFDADDDAPCRPNLLKGCCRADSSGIDPPAVKDSPKRWRDGFRSPSREGKWASSFPTAHVDGPRSAAWNLLTRIAQARGSKVSVASAGTWTTKPLRRRGMVGPRSSRFIVRVTPQRRVLAFQGPFASTPEARALGPGGHSAFFSVFCVPATRLSHSCNAQ